MAKKRPLRLRDCQNLPKRPMSATLGWKIAENASKAANLRMAGHPVQTHTSTFEREPRIETIARRSERETSPMQGAHRENSLTERHVDRLLGIPTLWTNSKRDRATIAALRADADEPVTGEARREECLEFIGLIGDSHAHEWLREYDDEESIARERERVAGLLAENARKRSEQRQREGKARSRGSEPTRHFRK